MDVAAIVDPFGHLGLEDVFGIGRHFFVYFDPFGADAEGNVAAGIFDNIGLLADGDRPEGRFDIDGTIEIPAASGAALPVNSKAVAATPHKRCFCINRASLLKNITNGLNTLNLQH